jgi:glycosyl transferase family 25
MRIEDIEIYVINLDHRVDRLAEVSKELGDMGLRFTRFPAIKTTPGILGCGLSHLAVLKEARERKLPCVLIFEDDFMFTVDKETFYEKMEIEEPFDVVMLSYEMHNSAPYKSGLLKVIDAQTTSGYIVHSRFYDALINLYEEAMPLLQSTGMHWVYANDQIWKKLQPAAQWFAFEPRLGRQRASISDCSHVPEFRDYGV